VSGCPGLPDGRIKMRIAIDSREQKPFHFDGYECSTTKAGLQTGDYSVLGFEEVLAVERKSLDDLVQCLMGADRIRFEKELARARSMERFTVVLESSYEDIVKHRYRSRMSPVAVIQSIMAFWIRYGTPFIFAGSRRAAEYITFSLLKKYVEEVEKRWKVCKGASKD
jgi:DNA excision repair protein ERCC-4